MRNLFTMSRWPVCLLAAAAAACANPADTNNAAEANAAAEADNAAVANNAAEANTADAETNTVSGASAETFSASGSEPGWALTIGGGTMAYTSQNGPNVTEPTPAQQPIPNGYRYQGARLTVEVVHTTCVAASGERDPDTVTVTVDGEKLTGCGG
jgi:uncharacterized membrane protein